MIIGALPLSVAAQDDDMYFVPQKKSVQKVTDNYGIPKDVYYSGSDRDVDEYNRRYTSSYEVLGSDSTKNDTINFSSERGVYPDSIAEEDYKYTKKLSRFDDYDLAEAYWTGFDDGRFGWHSPWYYSRYGWYHPWRYRWYDPWYYAWYDPWYGPWYAYGWYDPWYASVYYGRWGGYYIAGGSGRYHARTIGAGTIRRDGLVHGSTGRYMSGRRGGSSRYSNRTVSGRSRYSSGSRSSGRSTYSGSRSSSYSSSFGSSRSSGSYSSGASRSSGGSFGGGGSFSGGGGSRSSGGGSRMGGRR